MTWRVSELLLLIHSWPVSEVQHLFSCWYWSHGKDFFSCPHLGGGGKSPKPLWTRVYLVKYHISVFCLLILISAFWKSSPARREWVARTEHTERTKQNTTQSLAAGKELFERTQLWTDPDIINNFRRNRLQLVDSGQLGLLWNLSHCCSPPCNVLGDTEVSFA